MLNCGPAWAAAYTQIPHRLQTVASRARRCLRTIELSNDVPLFSWPWSASLVNRPAVPNLLESVFAMGDLGLAKSMTCSFPYNAYQFAERLLLSTETESLSNLQDLRLSVATSLEDPHMVP